MKTFLRILIIGAILLILVLLSVGIVRIVPKALSSLASATVSINSLFTGSSDQTNTGSTTPAQVVPNGNGFIVVGQNSTTTPATSGTGTSTRSLLDILKPNFNKYGPNNYVPTPGTNTNTYNQVNGTRNGQGVSTANTACQANGTQDLAVTVIGKGVISKTTGQYIESNSFTTGDMVSIKFKVENRGTCPSGTWSLVTTLPSQNTSDKQRTVSNIGSLQGGSAVTGQANFDMPLPGNVSATFTVVNNSGKDIDNGNNTATAQLSVVNTGTVNPGTVITTGDGRPDLLVRIVQTGVLTYNNQFIPNTNNAFRAGDRVALKFEVINQGQSATGPWNFKAELGQSFGGYGGQLYQNPQYEAGLPAGAKAVYTIAFDNIQAGTNLITITADYLNQVSEFNESNNSGTATFYVGY